MVKIVVTSWSKRAQPVTTNLLEKAAIVLIRKAKGRKIQLMTYQGDYCSADQQQRTNNTKETTIWTNGIACFCLVREKQSESDYTTGQPISNPRTF